MMGEGQFLSDGTFRAGVGVSTYLQKDPRVMIGETIVPRERVKPGRVVREGKRPKSLFRARPHKV